MFYTITGGTVQDTVHTCPGNKSLKLTCATNNTDTLVLKWTFSVPPALTGKTNNNDYVRYVQNGGNDSSLDIQPLTFNGTMFTFARKFEQDVPFSAEVVVNRIVAELNGTVIVCDEFTKSDNNHIRTDMIHVIGGR